MIFLEALENLNKGKSVKREGWAEDGVDIEYITRRPPTTGTGTSLPMNAFYGKNSNGNVLSIPTISVGDIFFDSDFRDDWVIVE